MFLINEYLKRFNKELDVQNKIEKEGMKNEGTNIK